MPSKKRATPVSLQPLDALFGTNEETTNGISEIAIGSLHPFTNHPFQVRDDKKMEELAESITQYGVLVPGIVRLRAVSYTHLDVYKRQFLDTHLLRGFVRTKPM